MGIYIKNISKCFGGNKVLDNINIELDKVGIYAFIGRSGAGKSTLVNILSGLEKPTSGTINLIENGIALDTAELRKMTAVIYQEVHLMNGITVRENIEIAMQLSGQYKQGNNLETILGNLGLLEYIDKKVQFLSGGEKQRVAIARAYCTNKSVIIADEPTCNLDDENALVVFNLLSKIAEEKIVILVSHDIEMVEKYSDYIYYLEDGIITTEKCNYSSKRIPSASKIENKKSQINTNNYFKLMKHILHKKSWIYMLTTMLTVFIMVLLSTLMVLNGVSYKKVMLSNITKDNSQLTNIIAGENSSNWYIDDVIRSRNLSEKNKGFYAFTDFEIDLDKSNIEEDLYYFLFDRRFINSLIELDEKDKVLLVAGAYPKSSNEVLIPQYWVEQCIHFNTPLSGYIVSNLDDILNKEIELFGEKLKVVGVHKSDMYYASLMKNYKVKHLNYQDKIVEINKIIDSAKLAPSLTTLYFGQDFRELFIAKYYSYFNNIVSPYSFSGYAMIINYNDEENLVNLSNSKIDEFIPKDGEIIAPLGYNGDSNVTLTCQSRKKTLKVVSNTSERGYLVSKNDFEYLISNNIDQIYNLIQLNKDNFDMSYNYFDNSNFIIATNNNGLIESFTINFTKNMLLFRVFLWVIIIFLIALNVMVISVQIKDNQKDMGIMMSFGGKIPLIVALFSSVNLILLIIESLIAIPIMVLTILIINSSYGILGLSTFNFGVMDILLPMIIGIGVLFLSMLILPINLHKKNIISYLRK